VKDKWYGDKRDLVKWGVLLTLAKMFSARRILQVAYYRPDLPEEFLQLEIDGKEYTLPEEVKNHFLNISNIRHMLSETPIDVLADEFKNNDRDLYHQNVINNITNGAHPCLVFLDPDTGLAPPSSKCKLEYVSEDEIKAIWSKLNRGDILACYQHRTNRDGNETWADAKKKQFEKALDLPYGSSKLVQGTKIAGDAVILYCQKT
jgi:hypothetical protein